MLAAQVLNGLMEGMMLFLIASGLTLIFGITRIVNFAHGSFYMLGAFLTYTAMPHLWPGTVGGFAVSVLLGALAVFEMLVLRRIYGADDLLQLIITVALVLILRDIVRAIWGPNNVSVPMPAELSGAVQLGGTFLPSFQLAVFGVGLLVVALMIAVIRYTRAGILLRAATDDRGMVALLGINQARIFTSVFAVGSFLAGFAGGLAAPFGNVSYLLDTSVIVMAFIVVVIGGLGNLYGALLAALAVGVIKGAGVLYFPRLSMVLIFLIMAVVLMARSLGRAGVSK
jgi:branched-subunit amino acid ABC-type transport system permease component